MPLKFYDEEDTPENRAAALETSKLSAVAQAHPTADPMATTSSIPFSDIGAGAGKIVGALGGSGAQTPEYDRLKHFKLLRALMGR